jgi:hypothetical protein
MNEMRRTIRCSWCGKPTVAACPFSEWCRVALLPSEQLGVCDVDYVFHRYKSHRKDEREFILIVEVKTRVRNLPRSQHDTLGILHQLTRTHNPNARDENGRLIGNGGSREQWVLSKFKNRLVRANFLGVHLLQLSGDDPVDSKFIWWNRKPINLQRLIQILNLDVHPRSFNPLSPRRRKRNPKGKFLFPLSQEDSR